MTIFFIIFCLSLIGNAIGFIIIQEDIKIIEDYTKKINNLNSTIPFDYTKEEQNHFAGDR